MAKGFTRWLVLLWLLQPQAGDATPDYRVVQQWTAADGLPAETIAGLAIDRDLQLWLATYDGIVRYQGFDFQHYNRDSSPALPGNRLMDIQAAPDEGVVVHFENGQIGHLTQLVYQPIGRANPHQMVIFDRQAWFIDAESGILWTWRPGEAPRARTEFALSALHVDLFSNRLLLGARDGSVLEVSAQRDGIARLSVQSIRPVLGLAASPEGDLLILDARGARLESTAPLDSRTTPVATWERLQNRPLRAVWTERGWLLANLFTNSGIGPHLLGTAGLRPLEVASATSIDADRSPSRIQLTDDNGHLWINDGLNLYRDGQRMFRADRRIKEFAVDPFGQIWIAQPTRGLQLLKQSPIETLGRGPRGLPDPNINLVTEFEGDILVGSWTALSRLDRSSGQWTHLSRRAARDVIADGDSLLLGSHGLCRLHGPENCTEIPDYPGGNAEVLMLHRDALGAIWAGTDSGLFRRDPTGNWHPRALSTAKARTALEDPSGRLLLGTNGDGILVFPDPAEFRQAPIRITTMQGLSSAFVRSLLGVANGATLVGTEDAGLCLMNRDLDVVRCLSTAGGLPHHSVHYMLVDASKRLWVNTNAGIYHVELVSLLSFLNGRRDRLPGFSRIGERQGMLSVEGNGGVYRAGAVTSDGQIWFPNQLGLVTVRIESATSRPEIPLVAHIHVAGGATGTPLRLPRHARQLDLELTAIALAEPQNVQFRYRLGSNSEWRELGHQRRINFRELPPGRNLLEAEARYPHMPWSGTPAQLEFTAEYRLNEHPVFRGIVFGAGLLAVIAVWRIARRRKRLLERAIEERSGQLEQATEQLARLTGSLRRVDFQHRSVLQAISQELKAALDAALEPLLRQQRGPMPARQAEKFRAQARILTRLIDQFDTFRKPAASESEVPADPTPANTSKSKRTISRPPATPANDVEDTPNDLEARIRMVVLLHLGDAEFSVDDLARRLGMSRSVLYRRASEFYQSSPAELVREVRLKRAAELLTESNEQISTIAYTCGFRSVSAFSRAFSKFIGITPREWRKRGAE